MSEKVKKRGSISAKKKKDLIFYILFMAYPVIQFVIFYIFVNINSFLLAFKTYNYGLDGEIAGYAWTGLSNFGDVIKAFGSVYELKVGFKNSMLAYALGLFVTTPLCILFAYFIYKGVPGGKFFRFVLYLPSVISAIVMVMIFKYFVEEVIPYIFSTVFHKDIAGPLTNPQTRLGVIMFYNVWIGFGASLLMYSGAMSGINESITEAAKIEGANSWHELFYIVLPLIFPTLSIFLIASFASICTNQINLYSFYGSQAEKNYYTLGYYLFNQTTLGTIADYPFMSAMGLLMTFVVAPLTLLIRWLLLKFGPSA